MTVSPPSTPPLKAKPAPEMFETPPRKLLVAHVPDLDFRNLVSPEQGAFTPPPSATAKFTFAPAPGSPSDPVTPERKTQKVGRAALSPMTPPGGSPVMRRPTVRDLEPPLAHERTPEKKSARKGLPFGRPPVAIHVPPASSSAAPSTPPGTPPQAQGSRPAKSAGQPPELKRKSKVIEATPDRGEDQLAIMNKFWANVIVWEEFAAQGVIVGRGKYHIAILIDGVIYKVPHQDAIELAATNISRMRDIFKFIRNAETNYRELLVAYRNGSLPENFRIAATTFNQDNAVSTQEFVPYALTPELLLKHPELLHTLAKVIDDSYHQRIPLIDFNAGNIRVQATINPVTGLLKNPCLVLVDFVDDEEYLDDNIPGCEAAFTRVKATLEAWAEDNEYLQFMLDPRIPMTERFPASGATPASPSASPANA